MTAIDARLSRSWELCIKDGSEWLSAKDNDRNDEDPPSNWDRKSTMRILGHQIQEHGETSEDPVVVTQVVWHAHEQIALPRLERHQGQG